MPAETEIRGWEICSSDSYWVPGPKLWPSPSRELAYGAKSGSITIRILGLPKFQVTVEGPSVKNEDVMNVLPGQGTPLEAVTDEYGRFGRMTNNRAKSKKFGENPDSRANLSSTNVTRNHLLRGEELAPKSLCFVTTPFKSNSWFKILSYSTTQKFSLSNE
jgi:hypothetical protein